MDGNFMSVDQATVTANDAIYGSNRISYEPIIPSLCGNTIDYGTGTLTEATHKQVNYDVTQKFPLNEVSAVLRSTQTELPQVHGAPIIFEYCQYVEAVEFRRSNINSVNIVNINAGIIKELLKKWDYTAYQGINGNVGLKNNPNTVTTPGTWVDFTTLKADVDAAVARTKNVTGMTSDDYSDLNFTYTSEIAKILSETNAENVSNREKLEKSYPGMVFREIPEAIEQDEIFYISYRPMLTFHHASVPGQYGSETTNYGLTDQSLFTFESNAVQVEEMGAVQAVPKPVAV